MKELGHSVVKGGLEWVTRYIAWRLILERDADQLEAFLNGLEGDVVSMVPLFKRISLAQIYGATSRTKGVVVVEKV